MLGVQHSKVPSSPVKVRVTSSKMTEWHDSLQHTKWGGKVSWELVQNFIDEECPIKLLHGFPLKTFHKREESTDIDADTPNDRR